MIDKKYLLMFLATSTDSCDTIVTALKPKVEKILEVTKMDDTDFDTLSEFIVNASLARYNDNLVKLINSGLLDTVQEVV